MNNDCMLDETLRQELVAMRTEDLRVRKELMDAGELGGPYVPRMEAVHVKNSARLPELIAKYGWPTQDIAGKDGAEAAWFIAQHAIGEPEFQRTALTLLQAGAAEAKVPAWHAAYLEDRIAMQEGRPQSFGTQWMDDPRDGLIRDSYPLLRIYCQGAEAKGAIMSDAPRITPDDLKRRMDAGEEFTVIDVRNPQAWAESDTMIPEAIRVPIDDYEGHLSEIPKSRAVVTYCT